MSSKFCERKNIGTFAPLFSLWSDRPGLGGDNGTLGMAPAFLVWLSRTGQRMWQLLPLAETHLEPGSKTRHVPSPYKGYGVGLSPRWLPEKYRHLEPVGAELDLFIDRNGSWLVDYALFCALRDRFGTDDWTSWPSPIRRRRPEAVEQWKASLAGEIREQELSQWRLERAYEDVRAKADRLGIALVGDLPFYVPLQSPLVWVNQGAFVLGRGQKLTWQSGIPLHATGHFGRQVWGHPLYNWKNHEAVMAIWRLRLEHSARLYDLIRIDHPKGFYQFGAMHIRDSRKDKLTRGPGTRALLDVVEYSRAQGLEVMAEDAGYQLSGLRRALRENCVAGIRMFRFAYNEKRKVFIRRYADMKSYPERSVAYPSTHDTESLVGYLVALSALERRALADRVGVAYVSDVKKLAFGFIKALIASPSHCVMVPVRDWIGSPARINLPGTERPVGDRNWRYRTEIPIEDLPDLDWAFGR